MSYKVTFRDGKSIVISDDRAEKLKALKLSSKPPHDVEIGEEIYQLSQIISITKAAANHDFNPPLPTERQMSPGVMPCRGEHSIQRAIHMFIVKNNPHNWPKLVRDKKLREKIRHQFRDADPAKIWCDYREGECACAENRGGATPEQVQNVKDFFAAK